MSFDLDTPKSSTLTISKLPGYICKQCGEEYLTESAIRQIESVENSLKFHDQDYFTPSLISDKIKELTNINIKGIEDYTENKRFEILSKIITSLNEINKFPYWSMILITIYLNNQIYDGSLSNNVIQKVIQAHFPKNAKNSSLMLRKMVKNQELYFDKNNIILTKKGKHLAETILFIYIENFETLELLEIEDN